MTKVKRKEGPLLKISTIGYMTKVNMTKVKRKTRTLLKISTIGYILAPIS